VSFPAAYGSVIGVGATDAADGAAVFSPAGSEVSLVAPGVSILSTARSSGYQALSGTSQAAPHVAGVVALALARGVRDLDGDGLVVREVSRLLELTARDLGAAGRDDTYGAGLVDAAAAVSSCLEADLAVFRSSRRRADTRTIALAAGTYRLAIDNRGLSLLRISVYEGTVLRRELSTDLSFRRGDSTASLDLEITGEGSVVLEPEGKVGAAASVGLLRTPCTPGTP
jgi:hypothetical protein